MMTTERLAIIAWEMDMLVAVIAVAAGIRSKTIFLYLLYYNNYLK